MSTEQKSGEDLIEKVEQETAEQTENKTEESTGFDAKAFAGDEETVKEELESPEQSEKEDAEEVDSTEETDEDGFEWESVEKKPEQPQEEDWDPKPEKKKETVEEAVYDWEALGQELGLDAKNEEDFKKAVKSAVNKTVPVNDTIRNMEGFLKMTDKSLVKADLEASGLSKEEVGDTVDRLVDSGLLKREAVMIRKNLQNYISNEREKVARQELEKKQTAERENLQTRKSLQKYIKEKKDFFGGKIKTQDRKELYNYITSGNFADEVYSNVANVADAAFLWKYKDKIFKMLRGQGMETGKASVINKITNPDLGRRSQRTEVKPKGGFDPVEFMK